MTNRRIHASAVRHRMIVTGEPYSVAQRSHRGGGVTYLRPEWHESGWNRLLPSAAIGLEAAISTATVLKIDGTLRHLIDRFGFATAFRLSDGIDTPLTWHEGEEHDGETRAIKEDAERAFHGALDKMERPRPQTIGALADLLAEIGVFRHTVTPDGRHQWRTEGKLPEISDVLRLPDYWIEREQRFQWRSRTGKAACGLQQHLREIGRPTALTTTVELLAREAAVSESAIRDGIVGLLAEDCLRVQRHGKPLDANGLKRLAEHARFSLTLDWIQLDEQWTATGDDDLDRPSEVQWQGSPWACCRNISRHSEISANAADLVASMPFQLLQPTGDIITTSLAELAASQGDPTSATVEACFELERVGALRWLGDQQVAELAGEGPF
jgi:Family of unknown function (DUF6042)